MKVTAVLMVAVLVLTACQLTTANTTDYVRRIPARKSTMSRRECSESGEWCGLDPALCCGSSCFFTCN
uniref:Conotoxin Cl6.7 n=1 Tax=Californiconus californicus TaxID=1736779 RepID=O167_CONCL